MLRNVLPHKFAALTLGLLLLGACTESPSGEQSATALDFPRADRTVSAIGDTEFSTEAARDEAGEAEYVMEWAGIQLGTTVADIGAGEGYYTIRLA